jgi:hypothetical protein
MAPRLATLSLSGIATFTGLVGIEHILRPDYDPLSRYVSEYAVGRYRWVMTTAFFALASGSATLLVDLTRTLPVPARSTVGLTCLGIWTGAIVVAGTFPTDLSGPDGLPEHPTTRGTIHGLAGIVAFASLPLAGILLGRRSRRDPAWHALARPSISLGVLEYAALALGLASPGSRKGITERLLIALDLSWLALMSLALQAHSGRTPCAASIASSIILGTRLDRRAAARPFSGM